MLAPVKASGPSARELLASAKRSALAMLPQSVQNWRAARYYGKYGEIELHLLDLLCRRHADSIDVGANDGCYIHFLRRYSRHVHAFEANPALAKQLRDKFGDGISIHPVALSAERGMAELHLPIINGVVVTGCATVSDVASAAYAAHETVSVPLVPLDDIYEGDAGFIKIDVEGHELAVLEGARRTIEACRPRLVVEIDQRLAPAGVARAIEFFDPLDYDGYFIRPRQLEPIAAFRAEQMQNPADLPDMTATLKSRERFSRYIYNFVFLPREDAPALLGAIGERIATL
jgi:FkbM family methyltransferase